MTWLLLLDRVNTAPGRAEESPLEGQPVLASLKHISTSANLIRVSKKKKKKHHKTKKPQNPTTTKNLKGNNSARCTYPLIFP